MPLLSAFTPLGMLRLSGEPSHAERIYRSIVAGFRDQFAVAEGSRYEAFSYAEAMKLARVKYGAEHAAGQALPATADVMLPLHESDHGLIPSTDDSLATRRAVLAVRWRRAIVPTRYQIEAALSDLLGDDFLALVTTSTASAAVYPATIDLTPCLLASHRSVRKHVRLKTSVSSVSGPQLVRYEALLSDGRSDGSDNLVAGEQIVIEPEVPGYTERVTIVSASSLAQLGGGTSLFFTASFTKPHHANCTASTANFPAQRSTKRHSLIVVTPSAASDPVQRRRVNEYMNRTARAASTWDIVQGSGGTTGVFTVGTSLIGAQTIESTSY